MRLVVTKSPSEALALTNCIIINPTDANVHLKTGYILIGRKFILATRAEGAMAPGQAGFSSTHRNWMQLALGDSVEGEPFDPLSYQAGGACFLERALFEVDVLRRTAQTALSFDTDRMAEVFATAFARQPLTVGQPIVMDFGGHNLLLKVHSLAKVMAAASTSGHISGVVTTPQQEGTTKWGVLLDKTELRFSRAPDSLIKLSGEHEINTNAIIQPDFKFEDMGIGGLDKEFWTIFRRAFSSRIYPQDLVQKLGIRHVKGLILYGPPGTGKTLMARQIAKMLHAREPKIVNGPEILNKYVGQSEENIRALFRDAELEYKSKGDNSQLHIIIFDELDAICKQRGARQDNTGVGDSVVNQLLAKMDGVEQLNNILVIGMTNRLDMLDEALLRPGRFEVQLEISLPDQQGRHQILKIHTKTVLRSHDKFINTYTHAHYHLL